MKSSNSFLKDNSRKIAVVFGSNLIANILPGIFYIFLYLALMQLTVPLLVGKEINFDLLWQYSLGYIGVFLLYILLSMWSQTKTYVEAYQMSSELRLTMGEKLKRLALSFFKKRDPGDVVSRLLTDVQKTETMISRILPDMTTSLISPLVLLVFLATINRTLAGIILAFVVFAGVFLFIAQKAIGIMGKRHVHTVVEASSRIMEYFNTIKLLKSYNRIGDNFETMNDSMVRLKNISFKTEVRAMIPIQIFLFCLDIGYLAMLLAAVRMCASESMEIQNLFSFAVIGFFLFETIKSLGPLIVEIRYIFVSVRRIDELLAEKEPSDEGLLAKPEKNDIVFDNVSFGYGENNVLNGISCTMKEKSLTALVGMSGSGKTTMTNLILRFWDVESGEIRIGGTPIKRIKPDQLFEKVSMVFQDVYLFNDTIANNIGIGDKEAGMEEIKKAAKLACCSDFIEALPNGYETTISEGGSSLSGGEKQRLSIARAILKDAPIVILDEATASLDPENEAEIQTAFDNLVKEKTVIVIAHQFKSIENADKILVLDKGKIIEEGRHSKLIEAKGLYCKLWEKQQKSRGWKMGDTIY